MILREFLGLIDLSRAETLYSYKLTKVIIIYQDKTFVLTIFKLIPLYFKNFDNG